MYKKQTTCTCIKLDVVVNSDRVKYTVYKLYYFVWGVPKF